MSVNAEDLDHPTFFDRPLFWKHLKAIFTYPFRMYRYRKMVKLIEKNAERWRKLALSPSVEFSPQNKAAVLSVPTVTELEPGVN